MVNVIGRGLATLKDWVERCLRAGGTPIFRTKFAGRRLENNAVIVACYRAGKEVPGGTIEEIPLEFIEKMEKGKGDWKWLVERLGIPYRY